MRSSGEPRSGGSRRARRRSVLSEDALPITRVAHPAPKNHDAYYEQEKRILDAWLGITGSEFGI
jgi:hypothetical protein